MGEKLTFVSQPFSGLQVNEQVSKLSNTINYERTVLLTEVHSRLQRLKRIVDEKSARGMPINKRELDCLNRFSLFCDDIDLLKSNSNDTMRQILDAVESEDYTSLGNIRLFPPIEPSHFQSTEELVLENLISDYIEETQNEPFDEMLKEIQLSHIISAVEMENGSVKTNKKVKKKNARNKMVTKRNNQPPAKKTKTQNQVRNFPPLLTQYVRGFFNVLRIILLTLGNAGSGLSTEQLCDIVHFWNASPRVQRTNSPWISRCSDWSQLVRPALALLSGRSTSASLNPTALKGSTASTEETTHLPPAFVDFNSATRTWCWAGSGLEEENEINLLARLFSQWVRKEGSLDQHSPLSPSRSRLNEDAEGELEDESEDEEEELIVEEEERSRRKALRTDRVPPPYFSTDWQCKLSTTEQRRIFQIQVTSPSINDDPWEASERTREAERYSRPWSPYVYNQHGYAAVVGPVLRATGGEGGSRIRAALSAREHPLLRPNRPPWVSLSEIVRDAVARLPNGEGTRPEIAMLVQDSGFLVTSFSQKQLNQCISSALDRLQSEGSNSPVMYDPIQRLWIYRFRHLSPSDFYRLYKDQIAFQRERFFQIYPGGGYRRPSNRPQSRSHPEEPYDDRHIPDIEELTREEEEGEEDEYYSSTADDDSREDEITAAAFSQPRRMRLEYRHHQQGHPSAQM